MHILHFHESKKKKLIRGRPRAAADEFQRRRRGGWGPQALSPQRKLVPKGIEAGQHVGLHGPISSRLHFRLSLRPHRRSRPNSIRLHGTFEHHTMVNGAIADQMTFSFFFFSNLKNRNHFTLNLVL